MGAVGPLEAPAGDRPDFVSSMVSRVVPGAGGAEFILLVAMAPPFVMVSPELRIEVERADAEPLAGGAPEAEGAMALLDAVSPVEGVASTASEAVMAESVSAVSVDERLQAATDSTPTDRTATRAVLETRALVGDFMGFSRPRPSGKGPEMHERGSTRTGPSRPAVFGHAIVSGE